ncbi:hypothetical protein [Kitasatospora sp. NPDC094016]|uniref:hypothetical protein n=1 Tax=Kitasatospora sp. NPDC094016 TaxID=3154986 RepID=UPI003330EE90
MYRRLPQAVLSGVLVVAFAGTTAWATTTTAGTAPAPGIATGCGADATAQGLATTALPNTLLETPRSDGRTEQFQQFYDSSAASLLPFVWHRSQDAPGGAYGAWERVSATPVGPKLYQVSAVENSAGALEVFFASYGGFCHTVLPEPGGPWTPTENFELSPPPYHGGLTLFRERDGRLHAFASGADAGAAMEVRSQDGDAQDSWGPVRRLPRLPDPNAGLGAPSSIVQLPDGRLRVTVREWNRDRSWRTTEVDRFVSWEPWQLCADSTCA